MLFGVVEICLDGVWAGEAKNEGRRKQYQTDEEAVKRNTEEWVEVMNPDEGIRRLELMRRQGRGEAGGRVLREVLRNGSRDVVSYWVLLSSGESFLRPEREGGKEGARKTTRRES